MQRKLIAIAIAGLSSAAFAQSNVTIYGVADGSFDFIKQSGSTATNNSDVNYTRVSANSSYIGFKGAEDLGNGLTAVFQYENGVNFDAAGGTWANRDSFVALAGGFGTVAMGNLTGPTRAFGAAVDVNTAATSIGSNSALLGKMSNALNGSANTANVSGAATGQVIASAATRSSTQASIYDNRFANAIAYISPTFAGVTVIAAYVANEGKIDGPAGTYSNPSAYDLGVKYAAGPVLVGLAYADVKLKNSADTETKNLRAVASFDFGMGTVRALAEQGKVTLTGVDNKQNVYGVGATFKVGGSGNIIGQYYKANKVTGNGLVAGDKTGAKLFEVGYEHSLSKRTMLKAVYSKLANEDNAKYDYGVNGVGTSAIANGAELSGLQIGLRHTF
jgi:predicted porin